jgi:hypothetical protein
LQEAKTKLEDDISELESELIDELPLRKKSKTK